MSHKEMPVAFCIVRARGVALVSAIFLMVVLAALGAFMLSFTTVQQSTSALDVEGTRAYWAAKSGVDRGLYQVMRTNAWCNCATGACAGTAAVGAATDAIAVGNFTVSIACTCVPVCEAGVDMQIARITANACNEPSAGACPNNNPASAMYVNRAVTGTAQR